MNIFYPDNLPISKKKTEIIEAIQDHQVVVIAGDTGSGKTTQLPKMCLEALPGNDRRIGCTQPRRIAATSVASRVADELATCIREDIVGFKIRFRDQTSRETRIKFMTDGVLLAETRKDPELKQYGVIIIDEAHERSLNIDFLLGYLKQLLPKRPDLKIIVTSATIDTEAFSRHFGNAPIIEVSGRNHPVTVNYQPVKDDEDKESVVDHCVQTVCHLVSNRPSGDILVFLPTERDIRECAKLLEQKTKDVVVLVLFGRLPFGDQKRIFQRTTQLKIIVATNVAETSVTVPGIRYVIDSGLARISHYNVRAKTTSLPVTRVSRASCDQRMGRCGRIGPGICIRLYSEEDYLDRDQYTLPELKRSNLAEVILQMISLQLGKPEDFPFLDPPFKGAVREGYRLLSELGAIDKQMQLTKMGKIMADLPIDPCISRIMLEANARGCLKEIKIIAAVLAIQDPRIRPVEQEQQADTTHKKFSHKESDFISFLNIWNQFHEFSGYKKSWSKLKKFCKNNFLSFQRMREWFDLHEQIDRILSQQNGFSDNQHPGSYEQIHQSLLVGFLRNLARKKAAKKYQGCHNKELMIFPGSGQFTTAGKWILGASFIETNRLYALTVATISPEWIEEVASDQCSYSWSSPRWHQKSGRVIGDEAVSLFGLVIASGRKVNFARRSQANIGEARDIFIQAALVEGRLNGNYPFLNKNLALIKKWQQAEEKVRLRDIVVDDLAIHNYYQEKLPEFVFDQQSLNRFLKKKNSHKYLIMKDEDILLRKPGELELFEFPQTINCGNVEINLDYHFSPGDDKDGVTFRIPVQFADSVKKERFEWLVPGLIEEKITSLLKALPKSIRKKLVPVSKSVKQILDDINYGSGSLYLAIEQSILKQFGFLVSRSDWTKSLPSHLQPRFLLFDDAGKEICTGRNLQRLINNLVQIDIPKAQSKLQHDHKKIFDRWNDTIHTSWGFEGLPKYLTSYTKSGEISGFFYPTISAQPDRGQVILSFTRDKRKAESTNTAGLLFLYCLHFKGQYKALRKLCATRFSGPSTHFLNSSFASQKELTDSIINSILLTVFGPFSGEIIEREVFTSKIQEIRQSGLFNLGQKQCDAILSLLRQRRECEEKIGRIFLSKLTSLKKKGKSLGALSSIANSSLEKNPMGEDFSKNLEQILPASFLLGSKTLELTNIKRQLQCFSIRLDRYASNPAKDGQKAKQLSPYLIKLNGLNKKRNELSDDGIAEVDRFSFLVGEYRISIFSPEMKTLEPVSPKKLDQQWKTILSKT